MISAFLQVFLHKSSSAPVFALVSEPRTKILVHLPASISASVCRCRVVSQTVQVAESAGIFAERIPSTASYTSAFAVVCDTNVSVSEGSSRSASSGPVRITASFPARLTIPTTSGCVGLPRIATRSPAAAACSTIRWMRFTNGQVASITRTPFFSHAANTSGGAPCARMTSVSPAFRGSTDSTARMPRDASSCTTVSLWMIFP